MSATVKPNIPNLRNQLLIAMPSLGDSYFNQSVTLICQHDEHGAMGVVINKPLNATVTSLLEQLNIPLKNKNLSEIYALGGGPIQPERGFVLHNAKRSWEMGIKISDELTLTASHDILSDIANDKGPKDFLLILGYAGWEPGQLEQELLDNIWLTCPSEQSILFSMPYGQRWQGASYTLGVDVSLLGDVAGHA